MDRALYSTVCNNFYWKKKIQKRIDRCIYITESGCSTPKSNTILYIISPQLKGNINLKIEENEKEGLPWWLRGKESPSHCRRLFSHSDPKYGPTCPGATKPRHHNYRARALESETQLLSQPAEKLSLHPGAGCSTVREAPARRSLGTVTKIAPALVMREYCTARERQQNQK